MQVNLVGCFSCSWGKLIWHSMLLGKQLGLTDHSGRKPNWTGYRNCPHENDRQWRVYGCIYIYCIPGVQTHAYNHRTTGVEHGHESNDCTTPYLPKIQWINVVPHDKWDIYIYIYKYEYSYIYILYIYIYIYFLYIICICKDNVNYLCMCVYLGKNGCGYMYENDGKFVDVGAVNISCMNWMNDCWGPQRGCQVRWNHYANDCVHDSCRCLYHSPYIYIYVCIYIYICMCIYIYAYIYICIYIYVCDNINTYTYVYV